MMGKVEGMAVPVQLALVIVVLVLTVVGFARRKSRGTRYPPGPFAWPFIGNVRELQQLSLKLGSQHTALLELTRRYESPIISLKLGSGNTIVVSGSECIHAVLSSELYDGRPWTYFIRLRNMGKKKGITMNDGQTWRDIRAWFLKSMRSIGFARRQMTDFIQDELVQVLKSIEDGGVRQMKPIIIPTIINVLWTFATGKRFKKDRLQHFIDLMDRRAQAFDMTGGILSAYPWIRYIAPEYSGYNLLITVNNELKAILMETIEEHKRNYVPGSRADLIDLFLNEMYAGKGPEAGFDEDQLVIILVDILLAGHNITATTLDFLFLNVLIDQNSQRLVHEEIDRAIGREKLPEFSDKAKLPYVEAVIQESQRLVPVAPILGPRRVLADTKLLDYDIPQDSIVILNLHSIHADPNLYADPYSFKPERFIKQGKCIQDENLFFFGKGHRQCPGIPLARSSLFIIFTGIMQRYDLRPVLGQKPPKLDIIMGMTIGPKPYEVNLVPRTVELRSETN